LLLNAATRQVKIIDAAGGLAASPVTQGARRAASRRLL